MTPRTDKAGLRSSYGGHPRVAALHLRPRPGDIAGNLMLAEAAVTEAKRAHPALRWVVLPELFTAGYAELDGIHRHAEDAEEGTSAGSSPRWPDGSAST